MNRYLSSRALLVLGLSLTLVACDSNDDEDIDALIGLWNANEIAERTLITVDQAQQVIDRSEPGQGGIQVTGDVSGTLRYFGFASPSGEDDVSLSVGSYNFRDDGAPFPRLELYLDPNSLSLSYYTSEDESQSYFTSTESPAYTFSNNVLTLDNVTLSDGAGEVTVDGSLTFATRSVPANQETEIDAFTFTDDDDLQIEFEADGGLIVRQEGDTERGTWEEVGDQLRLTFDEEDEGDSTLVSYDIDGNTLTLSSFFEGCEDADDEEECLSFYEQDYLLEEGSLTRVRFDERLTLQRASANDVRSGSETARRSEGDRKGLWPARSAPVRKGLFGTNR